MKNFIQFHRPFISEEEINEVVDTLRSGWLSMGPKTIQFEQEFKEYIGTPNSVSVNSWTAGGHLILEALGLKEGDEVIVPTMTFPATAEIVCYFKAKPVIVDVDSVTLNITPEAILKAITPKTKAIIPVHYAGQPCDMDEILEIAKAKNLHVIEDAAHALPSTYKGKKIGTVSPITCFSFYATKTLAAGEGGMICTSDELLAERTKIMRLHGINRDAWKRYTEEGSWYYEVVAPGFKYNLTDIQASLALIQLRKVELMWKARADLAEVYTEQLKDNDLIELPTIKSDRTTSWHLYPIRLKLDGLKINRSDFILELKKIGIGVSVHFMPVHKHKYYQETFDLNSNDYPVSEDAFQKLISLPIYPNLGKSSVETVVDGINTLTKKYRR